MPEQVQYVGFDRGKWRLELIAFWLVGIHSPLAL